MVDESYFRVIHHEMGHIEYFMAYKNQPTIFQSGANSGFHEAIGDTISLSVLTDTHLKNIGLIQNDTTTYGKFWKLPKIVHIFLIISYYLSFLFYS